MNIRQYRSWMYNRLLPGQKGYTDEFLNGVEKFVSFACQQANSSNGKIKCPCSKCKNLKYVNPDEVRVHLYKKGFIPNYWYWTCHGENDPDLCEVFNSQSSTSTTQIGDDERSHRFETVVHDLLHAAHILSQIPSTASPTVTPSPTLSPAAASSSPTPHFTTSPSVPTVNSSTSQIGVFASRSEDPSNNKTCDNKTILNLDGLGFLPSHLAANGISDIFKSHYIDPWPSWKKIPPRVRETWFEEFTTKFSICPSDHTWARKNFEMRGAALLKNALNKARSAMNKPSWLGNPVWNKLCEHWASEAFKKKSKQAKTNRASDCGGFGSSLHTGGSITTSQHKANLTKLTGKAPSPLELFRHTHKYKDKTWVDKRSAHVDAEYTRLMEEMNQKASEQGIHPPNELNVWRDTVGVKKGRIYGLGLESTVVAQRSYFCGSCSKSNEWVRREEHEELAKKIQEVRNDILVRLENNERELKKNNQSIRETRQMMFQLFDLQRSSGFQDFPSTRDTIEVEDEEEKSE